MKWSCVVSYKRAHYTGSGLVLYHTKGHTTQEVVFVLTGIFALCLLVFFLNDFLTMIYF